MDDAIRVLYVDDEPALLNLTRIFLEKDGFRVTTCTSASKALQNVNSEDFDVIVSDYQMPDMGGIDFLKKIRQQDNNKPFIIFTGHGREEIVIEALNHGADFYLQKGGEPKAQFMELKHKIRLAVEKRRTKDELISAHDEIRGKLEEEKIVTEFSRFLLMATSVDEVLDYFGEIIFSISGADYLMLAKLDPAENVVGIHSFKGLGPFLNKIRKLTSIAPESLNLPMDYIRAHKDLMPLSPGLKKLDNGIYTLSRGYLPQLVCTGIETLLGIRKIYIYELVLEENLYGSVTFALKQGNDLRNQPLIITLSNLLANGLWRIYSANAIVAEREALAQSEAKWRSLLDNSLDGIIIIDFSGKLLFANKRAGMYLGIDNYHEMVGKVNMLDFLSVESKVKAVRDIVNVKSGRDSYLVQYKVHTPLKRDMWIHCVGKKLIFERVPAILLSIHDISEQKLAEAEVTRQNKALSESEERFRELTDLLPQIVFETDMELKVTYGNQHALEIFGLIRENLESAPNALQFIDPAQHEELRENIRKLIQGNPDRGHEYTAVRSDGTTFPALIYSAPIFRNGELAGLRGIAIDITERKRFEEALQKSEKKYRDIIENMQDVVYRTDKNGKLLMFSPYGVKLAGYASEEEMIGLDVANDTYKYPKEREWFLAELRQKGFVENYPLVLKTKNGKSRFVTVSSHFYYDEQGTVQGVEGIIHDITERRQAEDELRESERKFASVFKNNPVALTLVSATNGRFVDVNDTFLCSTGFTREEVIGKTSEELGIFPDEDEYARFVTLLQEQKHVQGMELHCRIKTGEIRNCRFSSTTIIMGGIPRILSTVEDSTDRKTAEVAFQAMVGSMVGTTGQASLDQMTESISSWLGADCTAVREIQPDGHTVTTLSMYLDGGHVQDTCFSLDGTPCENAVKEEFCWYPDNVALLYPEHRELARLGIRGYLGIPLKNSKGDLIGILCVMARKPLSLPANGREILDIIAVKAVAEIERNRWEEALQHVNRQLKLMNSITGHDIKNKIAVILGYLDLASEKSDNLVMNTFIGKVESATKAIESQIEFTQTYQNLGTHDPQWQDLDAVLDRLHEPKEITLTSSVSGIEVYADPMLEKVFFNLLDNSMRHGERVSKIAVSARTSGNQLVIVWEDNGVGVPAADKERIFEHGYGKNTGLGLLLIREILSLTGISIQEVGKEGAGACFEILVPDGAYRLGTTYLSQHESIQQTFQK
jgi:PAS domain S-box-containing protein